MFLDRHSVLLLGSFLPVAILFLFSEGIGEFSNLPLVCYPFLVTLTTFLTCDYGLIRKKSLAIYGPIIASVLIAWFIPTSTVTGWKNEIYFWSTIIANGLTLFVVALFHLPVFIFSPEKEISFRKLGPAQRLVNVGLNLTLLTHVVLNLTLLTPFPSGRSTSKSSRRAYSTLTAFKFFGVSVFGVLLNTQIDFRGITVGFRLQVFMRILNFIYFVWPSIMFNMRALTIHLLITCLATVASYVTLLVCTIRFEELRDTWKGIKKRIIKGKQEILVEEEPAASISDPVTLWARIEPETEPRDVSSSPRNDEQDDLVIEPREDTFVSNLHSRSLPESLSNEATITSRKNDLLPLPYTVSYPNIRPTALVEDTADNTFRISHDNISDNCQTTATANVTSRGSIEVEKGEKESISHASEVPIDIALRRMVNMRKSLDLYCSLFPADYEFTRDTLVLSWIATGVILDYDEEDLDIESVTIAYFNLLLAVKSIVPYGYDRLSDQMSYKFEGGEIMSLNQYYPVLQYKRNLDSETNLNDLEHLSLIFEGPDERQLKLLNGCRNLKTLLMHKYHGSNIDNLLKDLFMKLEFLTILDLSCTSLVELPSSVDNLKELKYLDISHTLVKRLPEAIDSLVNLETLLLIGCRNLFVLPIGISKLKMLKHLALEGARQLESSLTGIGNLTNLRTLRTYPVGTKVGKRIAELENLKKLKGSLCILKLENVLKKEEAQRAMLCNKPHLTKLQLFWSDLEDAKVTSEEEILENLRPHFTLQELEVHFYSGGIFPSWISDPSLTKITSITLSWCRYCEKLPSLGDLPSLKFLSIIELDGVVEIDSSFCRERVKQDHRAFPKLEKLSLEGMSNLISWTGVEDWDFPCLLQLSVTYCPKFVSLPSLTRLNSLENLEVRDCPELPEFS